MERTNIEEYDDILYLPDVMEYLKISRDIALKLFNDPEFPSLNVSSRRKRVLKSEFINYLATHAR